MDKDSKITIPSKTEFCCMCGIEIKTLDDRHEVVDENYNITGHIECIKCWEDSISH